MICQKCKSAPASVCVTQVVDSVKTDTYLCQKCANESAAAKLKAAFGFFDVVPGHLVFGADPDRQAQQDGGEPCPECGATFAEIQKNGKLGCANCYSAFRAKLRPIITRIHRSAQHRGKRPPGAPEEAAPESAAPEPAPSSAEPAASPAEPAPAAADPAAPSADPMPDSADRAPGAEDSVDKLKAELAKAVADEEYEKAAELRDAIKALENRRQG